MSKIPIEKYVIEPNGDMRVEVPPLLQPPCSRSLDLFEDWEQFCKLKITGYTFRDGTDVCRFNLPDGKLSHRTTDHMAMLLNQGWQITAIHYENNRTEGPPPSESAQPSGNGGPLQ